MASQLASSSARRMGVIVRIVNAGGIASGRVRLVPVFLRLKSTSSSGESTTVSIGDVTKRVRRAHRPELVPAKFLAGVSSEVPPETRQHLRWMMQKDLLGQDIFLIGRPSPIRRSLAMQYLELTGREMEFVALSRDTTESDLKQRREIVGGTAHYVDQSAVQAASEGRVLVLEGIEKAERNVLPVLNNLLENREMHLEDGRLLIPAARYDRLLEEHSQAELDKWKLVRVSEDFRVIALGLPVPKYIGNPLDPPLRSRFQGRDVRHLPYEEQQEVLRQIAAGTGLGEEAITKVLSLAHTLVTEESSNLGLPDFPVENLPPLVSMLSSCPSVSVLDAMLKLYPYKSFLPEEGCQSVEDTMKNFDIDPAGSETQPLGVESVSASTSEPGSAAVSLSVDGRQAELRVPAGPHPTLSSADGAEFVPTYYHDRFIADLMLSHSVKDFCVIGPKGCGKSMVIQRLADLLGYEVEPIMLYQDMTSRDLLQQRTTLENGDTVWRYAPLVTAALKGKMAVLDGIHRIHRGTLAVLHRLVHDRELQLYDGTRLLRHDRYDAVRDANGLTDAEMAERGVLKIQQGFRIAALAEPPVIGGSSKEQWLTPEILSMFLFHTMRPLSMFEEKAVLKVERKPHKLMEEILQLTHRLRKSEDSSLKSIANSLSTRQLLRISRRLERFPGDTTHHAVQKACLTRFLPSLANEALDQAMDELEIARPEVAKERLSDAGGEGDIVCQVKDGVLHLGGTTAPVYRPETKTKIPETLFYDTAQNVASMEAMLQDFLLGEHLLLVGNQGVGKNKLVDRLLNLLNRPREYIQLHRDTTVQSLTLQPTVRDGVIVYEDSPLVKAVKTGFVLVVDEADKAPTHVTCILKTLVESGEMILSDGRRIVRDASRHSGLNPGELIKAHPDFRMIVLANRPGFPFLGNDFFGSLGDLFSCHAIDNPSINSEMSMLKQYGPNVSEETLRRLVRAFSELRTQADEGLIQYPYSTREVVNIVRHLEQFPNEGLGSVVRNVFDFDSYDKEAREAVEEVLHKHGIPIGTSPYNISLARQFELPSPKRLGHWQVRQSESGRHFPLAITSKEVSLGKQVRVKVQEETLDRVEARGVGFSEMQSYWSLPFHDYANVGDVCVGKDAHKRQLYDTIHVATSNPVWLYTMKATSDMLTRVSINHFFDAARRRNAYPKLRMATLGGEFSDVVAVHDEVTNSLVLVQPESGAVIAIEPENLLDTAVKTIRKVTGSAGQMNRGEPFFRMVPDFAVQNRLIFFTPDHNVVQMLDLSNGAPFMMHRTELPFSIKSLHPVNANNILVTVSDEDAKDGDRLYLMEQDTDGEGASNSPLPNKLIPVGQSGRAHVDAVRSVARNGGLSQFGLKFVIGEAMDVPNTLLTTDDSYATLVLGFPDLKFSNNEVYSWPKDADTMKAEDKSYPSLNAPYVAKKYLDRGKNTIFLKNSCQIVRPVSPNAIPTEFTRNNYGLASPGNISAYLEVVDLMGSKLRYVPVPEPSQGASVYSSWYKQTYPDQVLSLAETSNEGLVTVDNSGTVRLWETGVANLERSYDEWRKMLGSQDPQLTIERDKVGDIDTPKHGKIDPNNAPHIGGNVWAGGVGGRDTAGLGGVGGPYRLDAGHDVHQVSEAVKSQVPEHIRAAAREMNRKAFEERLREIRMSAYDAELYDKYASQVRKQVQALRTIISGLQAKAKERQWLKNQTQGELDDMRLIEGITGEKSIYKKRGEQEPEPGTPQEKPKKLRLLVDVSGSMYRFNGHDQRLERMMESALMVMEAFEGHGEKFVYDIVGHSGEEAAIPFIIGGKNRRGGPGEPKNEKERLEVLRTIHAHAQFCMSGDHTLAATATAINDLGKQVDDHDETFVIVLSDANFDRYGISPEAFAKILNRNDQVACFAIFIGSLGDQADRLAKRLPSGKAFVCLDTKKIPEALKTIFTSTMLK